VACIGIGIGIGIGSRDPCAKFICLMNVQARSIPHSLAEPPEDLVLLESSAASTPQLETVVYDPVNGGASHIKVSGGALPIQFDLQAGVRASLVQREQEEQQMLALESDLQQSLTQFEAGADLDRNTPADGHCLFHALRRGVWLKMARFLASSQ
jgi:hypothetical protein